MDPALTAAAIGVSGTVIVGLAGYWASVRNADKGATLTLRALELTEQGQVTDRYTKAIEQLGADKVDVRIGGIYALERIAHDSPRDHPTVIEVLAAFVRENSWEVLHTPSGAEASDDKPKQTTIRPDVQAAVTVIGHRKPVHDRRPVNLRGVNLPGADLTGANLDRADLSSGIDIVGTFGSSGSIYVTTGRYTNLTGADLTGANLTDANLSNANLSNATLTRATLTRANLRNANLTSVRWPSGEALPEHWRRSDISGRLVKADTKGTD